MAFKANEGTQTPIFSVENAGTEIGIVKLDIGAGSAVSDFGGSMASLGKGTITSVETLPDPLGSVVVTAGTVESTIGDVAGGTIDLITNPGESAGGTIDLVTSVTEVANLAKGTVAEVTSVTEVANIAKGTTSMLHAGTLEDLGSVAAVGQVHNAGTVASGSIADVAEVHTVGTIGSITAIGAVHNAGTVESNTPYSYSYNVAGTINHVVKNAAGFLHAILVGDAVASSIIEVSDDASDGDGDVVLYLAGDTLGPALYPVNMTMGTGISTDITNQTHVTFIYK